MTDLGFALHQLRKEPGFIVVAGLMPAPGIGANMAAFSPSMGVVPESSASRLATHSWPWSLSDAGASALAMLAVTGLPACRVTGLVQRRPYERIETFSPRAVLSP